MPGARTHRVVDGAGALTELEAAGWDTLLGRAGARDPLRRTAVLRLAAPAGQRAARPRAVTVTRDDQIVAAAALGVRRERGLVTVRHMGHSENWFDLEPPALDGAARRALADALVRQRGDLLVLEDLAADGPLVSEVRRVRPDADLLPGPLTFRIATGSLRERTSGRRREAGRLARRAAERGTPLGVTCTASWPIIERQLDALLDFQAQAWVHRDPDAFTGTPSGRAFVRSAVAAMGAENRARLTCVDVGGRLAAFHLSLVWGTRAVVYKTAFDRGFAGLPGLGWASLLATADSLASEGVRTIDLGAWGGAFKSHIADAEPTVCVRLALSPIGRAYLGAARAKSRAERLLSGAPAGRVSDRSPNQSSLT